MNEKRLLVPWGLPVRIAAFQTMSAKFYDKNSSFKSALLIVMFPHRRSTKVALETYPLHFEIIQFNKYNEKKVTAIFSQFRLQMELETKQGIPLTNHLLQFIFRS